MQGPHDKIYRIGDAEIIRIVDTQFNSLTGGQLFPDWEGDASGHLLQDRFPAHLGEDGQGVVLSVHSWLIRIAGKTMLIDTGIGNAKSRPFSPLFHNLRTDYMHRLAAAGVHPEDVDVVMLTHLHVDHVGWNTVWDGSAWRPTFPNARYVYAQAEEDFYGQPASMDRRMVFEDSVLPLIEAGLVDRVGDAGAVYGDHFTFHPTPGHCAGHMSIGLSSASETALFGGDIMHHPVQLLRPEWNSVFCSDGTAARQSRAWAQRFVAERNALYFSSHFGGTSVVRHSATHGDARWSFV